MLLIKVLLIFLFIYILFRYMVERFKSKIKSQLENLEKQTTVKNQTQHDKIVPCPACGTYNPMKIAMEKNGQFYCNESCFKLSSRT